MYEFIVAACVVFNGAGEAVNPCFVGATQGQYETFEQCKRDADQKKYEVLKVLKHRYDDASIVVSAPCGK